VFRFKISIGLVTIKLMVSRSNDKVLIVNTIWMNFGARNRIAVQYRENVKSEIYSCGCTEFPTFCRI
jgi:hypothetical protein